MSVAFDYSDDVWNMAQGAGGGSVYTPSHFYRSTRRDINTSKKIVNRGPKLYAMCDNARLSYK